MKIVILGASRGLGRCVAQLLNGEKLMLVSRNADRKADSEGLRCNVSLPEDRQNLYQNIQRFNPDKIINCIGAGVYGTYQNKDWKDHQWTFDVSFLFSAELLHFCLRNKISKQIVYTGSAVAESNADPQASSYAAAKHALLGLISSVVLEDPPLDVRLYSPPYMDTEMLPSNAWPRQSANVIDPVQVAKDLVDWISHPISGNLNQNFHKKFGE